MKHPRMTSSWLTAHGGRRMKALGVVPYTAGPMRGTRELMLAFLRAPALQAMADSFRRWLDSVIGAFDLLLEQLRQFFRTITVS
jgi:hypothetical protein